MSTDRVENAPHATLVRDIVTSLYERSDSDSAIPLSVFGLAGFGGVDAVCFAARGHRVIGVDADCDATALRTACASRDGGVLGLMAATVIEDGTLTTTADVRSAVAATDASLIYAGSVAGLGGRPATAALRGIVDEVGGALADKDTWHVVVFRGAVSPGACEYDLVPRLESASGKQAGVDFGVCVNPHFYRAEAGVLDFMEPPRIVIGEGDPRSGDLVVDLFRGLPGSRFRVPVPVAEMTHLVDGSVRGVEAYLADGIGAVCSALDVDPRAVMDLVLADTEPKAGAA